MNLRQPISQGHLLAGLFISPWLLIYALTAVAFNHALGPAAGPQSEAVVSALRLDPALDNLPLARQVLDQLGIAGEIVFVGREPNSLYIPVGRPGERVTVNVDLAAATARVEREQTGLWEALLYLHRSPGPHVAAIRGNWWPTRLWGLLADSSVLLTLFLGASGVWLWLALGAPRRTGLVMFGSGTMLLAILIVMLI